jgi:hypothetical protein
MEIIVGLLIIALPRILHAMQRQNALLLHMRRNLLEQHRVYNLIEVGAE